MQDLKRKLYGDTLPVTLQVGDRVKAAIYPKAVVGTVVDIVGAAIFVESEVDERQVCVHANAVQAVPNLGDIGYAVKLGVH